MWFEEETGGLKLDAVGEQGESTVVSEDSDGLFVKELS